MAQQENAGALQLYMEEDKHHKSLVPDDVVIRDYLSCIHDDTWVRHAELVKIEELKETALEEVAKQEVLRTCIEQWRNSQGGMARDLILEGILWQEKFMDEYKRDHRSSDKVDASNYKQNLLSSFRTKRDNSKSPPGARPAARTGSHPVTKALEYKVGAASAAPQYPTEDSDLAVKNVAKTEKSEDRHIGQDHPLPTRSLDYGEDAMHEIGDPPRESLPHSAPAVPDEKPGQHLDQEDYREIGESDVGQPPVHQESGHEQVAQPHPTPEAGLPTEQVLGDAAYERELDDPNTTTLQPKKEEEGFEHELDDPTKTAPQPKKEEESFEHELDDPTNTAPQPKKEEESFEHELDDPTKTAPQPKKEEESFEHELDDPTKTAPQPKKEEESFEHELDDPTKTVPQPTEGGEGFEYELDDPNSKPTNVAPIDEGTIDEM